MISRPILTILAAAALGLSACGEGEQEQATEQMSATEGSAAESAMETAAARLEAASESVKEAGAEASAAMSSAAQAVSEQTSEMAGVASAKAKEMIDSMQRYLSENDLDSARGIMDKLNQIKDSLPEQLKAEIEDLRQKLAAMTAADSAG